MMGTPVIGNPTGNAIMLNNIAYRMIGAGGYWKPVTAVQVSPTGVAYSYLITYPAAMTLLEGYRVKLILMLKIFSKARL
jgi:hypothetical protein